MCLIGLKLEGDARLGHRVLDRSAIEMVRDIHLEQLAHEHQKRIHGRAQVAVPHAARIELGHGAVVAVEQLFGDAIGPRRTVILRRSPRDGSGAAIAALQRLNKRQRPELPIAFQLEAQHLVDSLRTQPGHEAVPEARHISYLIGLAENGFRMLSRIRNFTRLDATFTLKARAQP